MTLMDTEITGNIGSRLKLNPSTGKITVKKGTLKGSYKIKVKVKSDETDNFRKASKSKTITVICR